MVKLQSNKLFLFWLNKRRQIQCSVCLYTVPSDAVAENDQNIFLFFDFFKCDLLRIYKKQNYFLVLLTIFVFNFSKRKQFIWDAIAMIPWQIFESNTTSFGFILLKLVRLRYWDRFLFLIRCIVFSVKNILQINVIQNGKSIQYALLTYNLTRILSQVLMYTHIMNCIWITIGKFNDGKETWIQTILPEEGQISDHFRKIYVSGIYYIVTTIATVGYGDISCATLIEMMYSCVCMFFGIAFEAFIQGGLVDAIKDSLLSGEIKEQKHKEEFQTWLTEREQNINNPLSHKKLKQMRECTSFKFKYEFSTNIFETEYFEYLPPYEQSALFLFYFSDITTLYSSFFRNISEVSVIQSIIACFKPFYIPKNGNISCYQEKSKGIYFIFKGKVIIEQVYYNNIPFRELAQGSFFGEHCLIDKQSKFNFKVSDEEDMYCFFIKKEKLFKICEEFPQILQQLMKFSHFRNKFFKIEGGRIAEKQNIFNNIQTQQKDTIRSNSLREKALSRSHSLKNQVFKDLARISQQEDEDQEPTKKKNTKKERFDLLHEIQQSSDHQNLQIFNKLQDENLIVNLYQQIIQLSHKLSLPVRGADQKQQDHIEFVKDIFQEQFEEECSIKKNPKQINQRKPKANFLSDIGKYTEYNFTENDQIFPSQNNFQLIQSKSQISQQTDQQDVTQVSNKDINNNQLTQTANILKMRSLSTSSHQGGLSLQRSRLSMIKEKDSESKQRLNSEVIRSSSAQARRNGILQSQFRENNQQNVHKKSQSEQVNLFQFSSYENNSLKQSDDNIISNLLYSSSQNNQQIESQKPLIKSETPFQSQKNQNSFLFKNDEEYDGQITSDIKYSKIKLNKKDDIQNITTNTQIFTNALLTLNTEGDQLITDNNIQKTGNHLNQSIFEDFQNNYERNQIVKSHQIQYANKNNQFQNQSQNEDFMMEQSLDFEENKTNTQTTIQQQSVQKEKKFLKQLHENEEKYFNEFYNDLHGFENIKRDQEDRLFNTGQTLNNKNDFQSDYQTIQQDLFKVEIDKEDFSQNQQYSSKHNLISEQDYIKEDFIQEENSGQNQDNSYTLQNKYQGGKRKGKEQIIELLISQDQDELDPNSKNIHQNSKEIADLLTGNNEEKEQLNNQIDTFQQKNIHKQSIFNVSRSNGEHLQNISNLQLSQKQKLKEQINLSTEENKNFNSSNDHKQTLHTQETHNQQFNEQNLITLTQGDEENFFFPVYQQEKEITHNKSMHIPTETNDYFNILEEKQNSNAIQFVQTLSGKPKKSHKDRFLSKNYFEESRRKSLNQKKKFQEQLEQIVNEAEQETSRRTISVNTQFNQSQFEEQNLLRNQSQTPNQFFMNQSLISNESKNNMIDLKSDQSMGQSDNLHIDFKPTKKESMESAGSKKHANTLTALEAKRRKISGYLDQSLNLYSTPTNKVNSFSQYVNKSEKRNSKGNLSNYSALLKIITLDKRFKKGKELEDVGQGQQKTEMSQTNNKLMEQTQENLDKNLPSIAQYSEAQNNEDENEFQDNLLDNSMEVPIEIIEPSFTKDDFYSTIPYLNNQIQRLESRLEDIVEQIRDCGQFCQEKMEQIKNIKQRRSKPITKDPNKEQLLMNFQKINLK